MTVEYVMGLVLLAYPKLITFSKLGCICKAGRRGQGKMLQQIYNLWGGWGWDGGEAGGSGARRARIASSPSLNYSSLAKPQLNPTLPLSLYSAHPQSPSLFCLIHCMGI